MFLFQIKNTSVGETCLADIKRSDIQLCDNFLSRILESLVSHQRFSPQLSKISVNGSTEFINPSNCSQDIKPSNGAELFTANNGESERDEEKKRIEVLSDDRETLKKDEVVMSHNESESRRHLDGLQTLLPGHNETQLAGSSESVYNCTQTAGGNELVYNCSQLAGGNEAVYNCTQPARGSESVQSSLLAPLRCLSVFYDRLSFMDSYCSSNFCLSDECLAPGDTEQLPTHIEMNCNDQVLELQHILELSAMDVVQQKMSECSSCWSDVESRDFDGVLSCEAQRFDK